ncbi:hypothetical protein SVAN01_07496 [Stagonosporopsis vannaccii]|nr:hypothetical protein SVAN01_07496 [Stagonosporopsis vannaccii]
MVSSRAFDPLFLSVTILLQQSSLGSMHIAAWCLWEKPRSFFDKTSLGQYSCIKDTADKDMLKNYEY